MPNETATEPTAASTKMKRLAIGILVFLLVYCGLWFLAAHQIETRLTAFLRDRPEGGAVARCENMAVRGFPFRIGVFCDSVKVDDVRRAASASFGPMRSAAQVYWPGHAVVEIDGPAQLRVSPDLALSADWTLLQASLQATFSGLDRTSVSATAPAGTLVVGPTGERLAFAAQQGELHLRRNGEDLDAAATLAKLDLKPGAGASLLPLLDTALDMTVRDRAGLMQRGGFSLHGLRGSAGDVHTLTLDLGNGLVTTATGPFTVSDQGLVSGEFRVTMRDVEGWRRVLVAAFPDDMDMIGNIANMLTALSAGGNDATVTLNVRDGTAFLAFIPIGVLPSL